MTYHLIYVHKTGEFKPFAFHAASDSVKDLQRLHKSIVHELETRKLEEYTPAVHSLSTEDTSWKSVIELDPWFKQFHPVFTDVAEYLKYLKSLE